MELSKSTSQGQLRRLLVGALPLGIAAILWRTASYLSPSIYMTVLGIFLFIALAVFYVKEMPMARQTLKWAWLILIGAGMNFAAILANGGTMPIPKVMSPFWWIWLGDWLPMGFSPGDVLMIIGFIGVTVTLITTQRKKAALAYEE